MKSGIIMVREDMNYRVLYGRLLLAGALSASNEVCIDVKGEGRVKVLKTRAGLFVKSNGRRLPVL